MKALQASLPSRTHLAFATSRRVHPWSVALLIAAIASGCADVGDDTSDDAGRVDVNYAGSGGAAGTAGSDATGGGGAAGGATGTAGQTGSDAQLDVGGVIDASVDSSIGDAGSADNSVRNDAKIDMGAPEVRPDLSGGPVDAPPEIREAEAGPLCGNGVLDPGEQCDDKNSVDQDTCTSLCTDNRPCLQCEENNCPRDPTGCTTADGCSGQPYCGDYPKEEDRALCFAVYACVIRTGCALTPMGPTACYCGHKTLEEASACKDGTFTPIGACKDEIRAAYKPLMPPPVVDANAIINGFIDVASPSGGAMSLVACDASYCTTVENGGNLECIPTKHPPFDGGVDGGQEAGSDSKSADTISSDTNEGGNPNGG